MRAELTKAERIALQLTHAIIGLEEFSLEASERKAADIYFRMVDRVERLLREREETRTYDPYETLRHRLS